MEIIMEKINFTNGQTPAINSANLLKLQENIEKAINESWKKTYPVGSYYETSDVNFDPNKEWGGIWELETDGTTLVSKSNVEGSKLNVDIGTIVGSETHKLTIDEIPEHSHKLTKMAKFDVTSGGVNFSGTGTWQGGTFWTENTGGGQEHNNIQPSKVVNRWHRTA